MHPETELLNKLIDQSTGCYTVCDQQANHSNVAEGVGAGSSRLVVTPIQ